MHRFYLTPELCENRPLTISGSEAHHALHVLRVRPGDEVIVLDGAGRRLSCRVQEARREAMTLDVITISHAPPLPAEITLVQAIPKGKIIESVIQKATELGARRIVPVLSERVITRLDEQEAAHKRDKWQTVAVEAIKQCGAAWLPRVETPVTLAAYLARNERFDLSLVASLQPGATHPRTVFDGCRATHAMPRSVAVWIGPEGDLTAQEVQAIITSGAKPVTLGELVLRVETAAVYALSIIHYELSA